MPTSSEIVRHCATCFYWGDIRDGLINICQAVVELADDYEPMTAAGDGKECRAHKPKSTKDNIDATNN